MPCLSVKLTSMLLEGIVATISEIFHLALMAFSSGVLGGVVGVKVPFTSVCLLPSLMMNLPLSLISSLMFLMSPSLKV